MEERGEREEDGEREEEEEGGRGTMRRGKRETVEEREREKGASTASLLLARHDGILPGDHPPPLLSPASSALSHSPPLSFSIPALSLSLCLSLTSSHFPSLPDTIPLCVSSSISLR